MLIYIDPSLMEYFECNEPTTEDLEALDNIISSHRKGHHYIISTRNCLDFLSKLDGMSLFCQRNLKMLSHDYTTLANIPKRVTSKIIVKPPNYEFKRIDEEKESGINSYSYITAVFEVPLRQFLNAEIIEKTRLVSEHLDDCHFYEFIGNEFSNIKNLPCSIAFDRSHGGGNDTYRIYEEQILNKHIAFVLVDSDKKEPEGVIGETSRKVARVYEEYKEKTIIGCEILPVHEKENLFSPKVYENFGNNLKISALEQLKILSIYDENFKFFPFVDIKEGLHSDNYHSYFEFVFEIPGLIPRLENERRNFDNEFVGSKEEFLKYIEEQKKLAKKDRTRKYLIESLSFNPLGKFEFEKVKNRLREELSHMHPNTPIEFVNKLKSKLEILENISEHLLEFQKIYFRILGTQIKEWGLANPKRSAY
ncbi:hypothetical protein [Bacillus cereus group sp. BfR-BA-01399]|uniref:hypothetical protein n=1 Tax=Bacillus cereus group TaxID=86661 RepID=UPI001F5751EF